MCIRDSKGHCTIFRPPRQSLWGGFHGEMVDLSGLLARIAQKCHLAALGAHQDVYKRQVLSFGDERLNAVMDEFGERRSSQG